MKTENVNFFKYVLQKIQKLKIMKVASVNEKNPEIWYG